MSQFTTPAKLEMLDNYRWRLLESFCYYTDHACSGLVVEHINDGSDFGSQAHFLRVPIGYVTDLASIPRILWTVFPPHGAYAKAAIIHDHLYSHAIGHKQWADSVFLEAMLVLKVPIWRAWPMYLAVKFFGRGAY